MSTGAPHRGRRVLLAGALSLAVVALFLVQISEARRGAGRAVGFWPEQTSEGVRIAEVVPGAPGAQAGLRAGDLLLAVDGVFLRQASDYDRAAAGFDPGGSAIFRVRRGEEAIELEVVPGVAVDWPLIASTALALLGFLGLAALVLHSQGAGDLRGRLLVILLYLVAFELALPIDAVAPAWLVSVTWALFLLGTGAQLAVELHLVSLIPDRRSWLELYPFLVPSYYVLGLGLGALASATFLAGELGGAKLLPWSYEQIESILLGFGLPVWAAAVLVILGSAAVGYPEPDGRQQAGLVFLGDLPWTLYVFTTTAYEALGKTYPGWLDTVFPLILLCFPVAVFVALFRYHLFDIELVVRRGLLYTALTTAVVALFYAMLAGAGVLLSRFFDQDRASVWVISGAALALGLVFGNLRDKLRRVIERRFFPERQALRRRLVELASELPAQGNAPRMGAHLVERLCAIFALPSATLLLADPRSGVLLNVASNVPDLGRELSLALLISPMDAGVKLLHQARRPLRAELLVAVSPALRQRFELLAAELAVPLINNDKLVGVLILARPETRRRFPAEERELLSLLGHQVASSLENVRLFESATYESLTGLLRREAILELLSKEARRARRYRRPLSIGFADLDHFKAVNDRHGHLVGDVLLKRVAEEMKSSLRGSDSLGRYGGEEFLLVFPETDLAGAARVAEKIRARVEQLVVPLEGGSLRVQISIGLAGLESIGAARDPSEALIAAADKALYRAKERGRNRVEAV